MYSYELGLGLSYEMASGVVLFGCFCDLGVLHKEGVLDLRGQV